MILLSEKQEIEVTASYPESGKTFQELMEELIENYLPLRYN